jgi:hypothetical protein
MVRDAQHALDLGGGLNGDTDVFTSQGFRIGTINPFAGISPEFGSGICSVTCRLPILSSLLNNNLIHGCWSSQSPRSLGHRRIR